MAQVFNQVFLPLGIDLNKHHALARAGDASTG